MTVSAAQPTPQPGADTALRARSVAVIPGGIYGHMTARNLPTPMPQFFEQANVFADEAARRGVYLHPSHNWFISAAHAEADIEETLEATTDNALARVCREFGEA